MLKLLSLSLSLSLSVSLSISFVVSVRSFCFQSLSPPTSTSSGSSSPFLLFTSLCISLCFQCLCMCHLCAMSIKLFFSVVVVESCSTINGFWHWARTCDRVKVVCPLVLQLKGCSNSWSVGQISLYARSSALMHGGEHLNQSRLGAETS